jgi:polysaccharide export outer membrane protein
MIRKRLFLIVPGLVLLITFCNQVLAVENNSPIEIVSPESLQAPKETKADDQVQLQDNQNKTLPTSIAPDKKDDGNTRGFLSYKFGPGDKIKITVFGEPDLSSIYTVNDKGIIAVPLIGDVSVAGLNVTDLKNSLIRLFSDGYLKNPSISIEVSEFRPVYVMGEVREPGSYSYIAGMSVLNLVAIAGGYTYRADDDEVIILRQIQNDQIKLQDIKPDQKLEPGDILLIKERFF